MRLVYFLFFLTTVLANGQSALKFASGDSLTFVLNSGSMYSGSKKEQLLFVRNGECVAVSYLTSTDVDLTPVLQNKMNISWNFLKDTLHHRLKSLRTIEEVFESHSHAYISVYNNGKPVTIKDKNLRVLEKGTKSKTTSISMLEDYGYVESFFNTLVNGFKKHTTASCNYRENKKMPAQGEN